MASTVTRTARQAPSKAKLIGKDFVPKVYSYGRFSAAEQSAGDSSRRQDDVAKNYALKNGLPYADVVGMFDEGTSGFHADHLKTGWLGVFMECVTAGQVAPGSVLVIEDVDRLSRQEPLEHLGLIITLVTRGISIHTPIDDTTYSRDSLNNGLLWKLIGKIERAHGESKRKSQLGTTNWEQKRKRIREHGVVLNKDGKPSRVHPEWIKIVDKRYELIPEAGESLVRMFLMKEQGFGKTAITKSLNANAPWSPPPKKKKRGKPGEMVEGWRESYVAKTLSNRAVIGELQSYCKPNGRRGARVRKDEPPVNVYPNALALHPGLFERVQELNAENKGKSKGGRNGKVSNLFRGLLFCAYCDGPMDFRDPGSNNGLSKLVCRHGRTLINDCGKRKVCYDDYELAILDSCRQLNPEQIVPSAKEEEAICNSLRQRIQRQNADIIVLKSRIASLKEQTEYAASPERRAEMELTIVKRETEKADAEKQLAADQRALQQAE